MASDDESRAESSRGIEERLDEVLEELSALANEGDLPDEQRGMLISAERTVATVYEQRRSARHPNAWGGRRD